MAGEHGSSGYEWSKSIRNVKVNGMTYEQWKARVNANVIDISGVSCDDIPDWDYRMAWESGETPAGAAREALECASFPFDD